MTEIAIGIDMGGTRIKAIAMDSAGHVLLEHYQPTNDGDSSVWKQAVAAAVQELKNKLQAERVVVGLSAPGLPNQNNTAIAFMPGRLDGLENFNWGDWLQHPVWVLNDAVAALMAEARFGAAKNKQHVVMLTLGTGVGGAILINGRPYQGAFNKAGHIGHMVVDDEGPCDVTGMPGSLEDCMGNCTIERRSGGAFSSTHALLLAARQGDAFAKQVWDKSVKQLAIGLASVINILSPEIIILGGGITQAGNDLFEPLEVYLQQFEWRPGGSGTPVAKAAYGDLSGAIGAASYAMDKQHDINNL
jgi:glucokinase